MIETNIYKKAFVMLCWAVVSMLLMRISSGAFGVVLVGIGVICALSNKKGWAMCHYALLMMMVVVNPILLPKSRMVWALSIVGGFIIDTIVLREQGYI